MIGTMFWRDIKRHQLFQLKGKVNHFKFILFILINLLFSIAKRPAEEKKSEDNDDDEKNYKKHKNDKKKKKFKKFNN